jgi:hypothetical protein
MLPDFPDEKKVFENIASTRLRATKNRRMPLFPDSDAIVFFEGDRNSMTTADGCYNDDKFESITADIELSNEQLENLTIKGLFDHLDRLALQLGERQMTQIIGILDRTCEAHGQVYHQRGPNDHVEALLTMMDMIDLEFDINGDPILPDILAGPDAAPKINMAVQTIYDDPDLLCRYKIIISRQRDKWRDRQSNRKLVG